MNRGTRGAPAVLALGGAMLITLGLVLLPAAAPSLAATAHAATQGPASGWTKVVGPKMLNPKTIKGTTASDFRSRSWVEVSTTKDLTNQTVTVKWGGFTPTNLEGGAEPIYNADNIVYPVTVVQCRGTRPTKISQCWQAQYYEQQFGSNSNAAYSVSAANGTGTVEFQLQDSLQNPWLGCSAGHPCSLAVIPAQGGLEANCGNHSIDGPADAPGTGYDSFYLAPKCAWAKHITVPLTFGPVETCPKITSPDVTVEGSPLMSDAMQQWDTGLCRRQHDPLTVTFDGEVFEPTAIQQVVQSGLADVALTTLPSPASIGTASDGRKYVYAPIGVTAIALVYEFDNPNTGQPYTTMRLNQRLVAKMMTTSYTLNGYLDCNIDKIYKCDKAVTGNPESMSDDPEFIGLNKRMQPPVDATSDPLAAVPIVLSGPTDINYEVTRWITSNPSAVAFLDGQRAPGGMRVDTNYRDVKWPTPTFTSRDPSFLLSLAYTPLVSLNLVTADLLEDAPPGTDGTTPNSNCPPSKPNCGYAGLPGESVGDRDLFGITDEADAAAYLFPTAEIRNGAGKYVAPTQKSMAAALKSMITAKNGVTQQVNLDSKNPAAYPLTTVVYAMVPISGVSSTVAGNIARWLDYVVGGGQTPGELPGRLPFGYLPLPAKLRAETRTIATEVADQTGDHASSPSPTDSSSSSSSPSSSSDASDSSSDSGNTSPSPGASGTPNPTPTPSISLVALRHPAGAGLTRYALPALLIIAGLAALLGASISAMAVGPGVLGRLRALSVKRPGSRIRRGSK
jgi:hypothetical protein